MYFNNIVEKLIQRLEIVFIYYYLFFLNAFRKIFLKG